MNGHSPVGRRRQCVCKRFGQGRHYTATRVSYPERPFGALTNWPFLLGLALYGTAFLLFAAAPACLPLNVAVPVLTSGAVAAVAVSSVLVFRESFHWTIGAGILLVIAGVALITAHVT